MDATGRALRLKLFRCNLNFENKKTAFAGRFFEGSRVCGSLNRGNWLGGAQSPKLSFQCSLITHETSRLSSSEPATNGYRQWRFVVSFRSWNQENIYLNRRGSRTKRGVRAYSPAWSEPPTRNPVAREGMRKRHLMADCSG